MLFLNSQALCNSVTEEKSIHLLCKPPMNRLTENKPPYRREYTACLGSVNCHPWNQWVVLKGCTSVRWRVACGTSTRLASHQLRHPGALARHRSAVHRLSLPYLPYHGMGFKGLRGTQLSLRLCSWSRKDMSLPCGESGHSAPC